MELEIREGQGLATKTKMVVITDPEGKVVFTKNLMLTTPAMLAGFGLSEDQLERMAAARRAKYSSGSPCSSSNNRPLVSNNPLSKRPTPFTPPQLAPVAKLKSPAASAQARKVQKTLVFPDWDEEPSPSPPLPPPFSKPAPSRSVPYVSPELAGKPKYGLDVPGYENVGAVSCFCNAVVRALVCLPALGRALLEAKRNLGEGVNQQLALAYNSFETKLVFNPSRTLLPLLPRFHLSRSQEDAHEFLTALLDLAETELVERGDWLLDEVPTRRMFASETEKAVECLSCHFSRKLESERFVIHSLGLPATNPAAKATSLQDLWIGALRTERVDDIQCDQCGKATASSLSLKFKQTPHILCLHLKRQEKTMSGIKKNYCRVEAPFKLDIPGEFICGGEGAQYELCSVVVHSGHSPKAGHYTALGKTAEDKWLEFDDRKTGQALALSAPHHQQNAVLYFYSRI
ncbi:hypothetical protein BASA81_006112 [Batrachochytrium salamandrivorans]|nr:hypothetical protein BASA81_006112 [Batrachochytrium salamandrivorans]